MENSYVDEHLYCEIYQRYMELIGSRWTAAILRVLLGGVEQFGAIRAQIPGISDRMLAERLRELEHEGIVIRTVIPETPVRVEYRLSEKGLALRQVMRAMVDWIASWASVAPVPLASDEE